MGQVCEARQGAPAVQEHWPRPLCWAAGICLVAGIGWRLTRYLLQFPIWGDEAMVLLDVRMCDYGALTQSLPICQIAPVLFLWLERAVLDLLGDSELAVRLPTLIAGTAALLLFAWVAWRRLEPSHAALSIAILAVSYWPVRHACEAKPYALDLLASVGMLAGTAGWLAERRLRWLVALVVWVPLAIAASYPAVFVAGAMSLVILSTMRPAPWSARCAYAMLNVVMIATFLGHYFLVARNQVGGPPAESRSDHIQAYWSEAFPPSSVLEIPWWLVKAHAGGLFAYPVGGANWGSAASLALAMVGAWGLWSARRRRLLLACVLPFGLTLGASAVHKYPYGGSPRVAQHLAPMACLLIASGGAELLRRLRAPALRGSSALVLCLALAGLAGGGAIRDLRRPYKTEYDRTARDLVHEFRTLVAPGEPVIACNRLYEVIPNYQWYLGRDRADFAWIGSAHVPPEAPGLWLLHFGLYPPAPPELQALLPDRGSAWSVAGCDRITLPKEAPGDITITWTRVHLVPAR